MTSARPLTAAEAVLALAAAETRVELHAAFLALINAGPGMVRPLDTSDVVSGDGTAGRVLLGDYSGGVVPVSAARRGGTITRRARVVWRVAGAPDESLVPSDLCAGSEVGRVHAPALDRYDERCTVCGARVAA